MSSCRYPVAHTTTAGRTLRPSTNWTVPRAAPAARGSSVVVGVYLHDGRVKTGRERRRPGPSERTGGHDHPGGTDHLPSGQVEAEVARGALQAGDLGAGTHGQLEPGRVVLEIGRHLVLAGVGPRVGGKRRSGQGVVPRGREQAQGLPPGWPSSLPPFRRAPATARRHRHASGSTRARARPARRRPRRRHAAPPAPLKCSRCKQYTQACTFAGMEPWPSQMPQAWPGSGTHACTPTEPTCWRNSPPAVIAKSPAGDRNAATERAERAERAEHTIDRRPSKRSTGRSYRALSRKQYCPDDPTRCWLNCWLTGSSTGGRPRTPTGGIPRIMARSGWSEFIRDEEVAGSNPVTPTSRKAL